MLTIVTPAPTQDLITLATFKVARGITGTSDDAIWSALITQASAMIAGHCGRVFREEVVTETIRPSGRPPHSLMLARFPIGGVSSISEGGITLNSSDYFIDPQSGILERICGDRAAFWNGACVVTYSGGYRGDGDPLSVPSDLQGACIDLVDHLKRRGASDPMLRSSEVDGVGSMSFQVPTGGIPEFILDTIDRYRNRLIA